MANEKIALNLPGAGYAIELSFNNHEEFFPLPILPESIEVKEEGQGKTYNIIGKGGGTEETRAGEINVIKSPKLREVSFSSSFPIRWYPFVIVKPEYLKAPYEYIDMIRKWWATKRPIRFIFVGSKYKSFVGRTVTEADMIYDLNFPASIESFTWKESAGSPGDIEYTLRLKEYVFYSAKRGTPVLQEDGTTAVIVSPPDRPDERIRPETYAIQTGDTLTRISMKFYQKDGFPDSSRVDDIMELNGITWAETTTLQVGREIKLPPN